MKFDIDWQSLETSLNPPVERSLDFTKVASQFRKVAFDVYEKIGEQGLWELQENEEGQKILVALYDESGEQVKTASTNSRWTATSSRAGDSVTLQLDGVPVTKFSGSEYGFDSSEAARFSSYIVSVAARDGDKFVTKLASTMPANQRAYLFGLVAKGETND